MVMKLVTANELLGGLYVDNVFWKNLVIPADNQAKAMWDWLIVLFVLYTAVKIPFDSSFTYRNSTLSKCEPHLPVLYINCVLSKY